MDFPRMIAPDRALDLVADTVEPLSPRVVPLSQAAGLLLAESIVADRDYPAFDRSMMDGYAVRAADAGGWVDVAGEVAAGGLADSALADGQCIAIMTGAPCPDGCEAVVPREEVTLDGNRVLLPDDVRPQQHIAGTGCECRRGDVILQVGQQATPLAIAVMASFGVTEVAVTPRPSLAVITTGAELVDAHTVPGLGQIRDSNGPMVAALAREVGLERTLHLHAEDTLDAILAALEQASACDLVLLTGGVSVGRYDHVPAALERCGAVPVFHKVRQKPGKPLLFAMRDGQAYFGLPGNPLAAHLCFHRYVAAAIRRMQGLPHESEIVTGQLAASLKRKPDRTYFVAGCAEGQSDNSGPWHVRPVPGSSSADVFACSTANCYIEVPPGSDEIPAGTAIGFTWIVGRR